MDGSTAPRQPSREAVDAAAAKLDIHELPASRGSFLPSLFAQVARRSIDGVSLLRRDLKSIVEPADMQRMATRERSGALTDLPSHAILDHGRVVGIREYDPAGESIAWLPFIPKNEDLEKAVAKTEDYVRSQFGDAGSFSLDSPKSRVRRLEALRKAAGRACVRPLSRRFESRLGSQKNQPCRSITYG